jgi:phosphoribosylformylglycinamidine (FGAM) synthase PurS component
MKLEFKKCSKKIAKELIEFYFNKKIYNMNIEDYKWSPAEIFEMCLNFNDLAKVLDSL